MREQQMFQEKPCRKFELAPNYNRLALRAAKELLAVELSEKMYITKEQAHVIVKCSDFSRFKHKYENYLVLRDTAEDNA